MTEKYESAPYPGLRPFEADEESLFFGRETQVDELLRRLGTHRFLAVVGTSGSGKSSLVRAGLFPAIHGGFMANTIGPWRIAILRPGSSPVANLASALDSAGLLDGLRSDDDSLRVGLARAILERGSLGLVEVLQQRPDAERENVLIVVDQFEELFRFANASGAQAPDEAAAFVKLLLAGVTHLESSIRVLITMRSDFLGNCARFRELPEAVNDAMFLIPRMTRDQLRLAIEAPARVVGAAMTPRLVNRLLNDLGDDPDELPVLAHALMRTWNYWVTEQGAVSPVDIADYQATGGMQHALSRHGDEIFDGLPSDRSRMLAERAFKALTELGEDNRGIRRPTRFESLCAIVDSSPEELGEIVNAFRASRCSFLMPPAEVQLVEVTIIDICHESLMRKWPRLERWVREEAVSVASYRRLAAAASLNRAGKAALWRDPDLSYAIQWREVNHPNKSWGTRDGLDFLATMRFLDQSIAARSDEIRRKRTTRVTATGALVVISAVLATLVFITHLQAVNARAALRSSQEIVLGDVALGLPKTKIKDAMILAAEASNSGTLPSRNAMYTLLGQNPRLRRVFSGERAPIFDASGRYLAMASTDNATTFSVFDTKTQTIAGGVDEKSLFGEVIVGECLREGKRLVAVTRKGRILTFDWRTRRTLASTKLDVIARSVGCSSSSDMLAIATANGKVLLVNTRRQGASTALTSQGDIWGVAVSPVDGTVVAGADHGEILIYQPRSHHILRCSVGVDEPMNVVHFASDGTFVALSSGGLWSYRMEVESCATHGSQASAPLRDLVAYPQNRTIDVLEDGRVIFRDQAEFTGTYEFAPAVTAADAAESITANDPDPDKIGGWVALTTSAGIMLYTTGTALKPMHEQFDVPAEPNFPVALAFSADSTRVLLGTSKGVWQWDVATGRASPDQWNSDGKVEAVALAPKVEKAFAVEGDSLLTISTRSGRLESQTKLRPGVVSRIAVASDASTVTTIGTGSSTVRNALVSRVNPATGETLSVFQQALENDNSAASMNISDNGEYFVAESYGSSSIFGISDKSALGVSGIRSFVGFNDDSTAFFERTGDQIKRRRLPDGKVMPGVLTMPPPTDSFPSIVATKSRKHWIAIFDKAFDLSPGIQLYDDRTLVKVGLPLRLPDDNVSQIQFSDDGNWVAAYSSSGKLYVFELGLSQWQQRACQIADEKMSQIDWDSYGAGFPYQGVCDRYLDSASNGPTPGF